MIDVEWLKGQMKTAVEGEKQALLHVGKCQGVQEICQHMIAMMSEKKPGDDIEQVV